MLRASILLLSLGAAAAICGFTGCFAGLCWLWVLPVSALGTFLALAALAFLFIWVACATVDLNKPQERDSKFFRIMAGVYIESLIPLLRVKFIRKGLEKAPQSGRFMLVCNHCSLADPVLLLQAFRKSQLAFISKQENSKMFLVGKAMHKLLCQTVNRENDREALKTIIKCIGLIQEDKCSLGVFPEGYIHKDKKLHHFRHGVFKIAQRTKVPIVVCTMRDTAAVFHNAARLKKSTVELRVLKVLQPEEFEAMTTVDLSERIYELMAADLGPERVAAE